MHHTTRQSLETAPQAYLRASGHFHRVTDRLERWLCALLSHRVRILVLRDQCRLVQPLLWNFVVQSLEEEDSGMHFSTSYLR